MVPNQPETRTAIIDAELDQLAEQHVDRSLRGPNFVSRRVDWILRDWLRTQGIVPNDFSAGGQEGHAADGAAPAPPTEAT